MPRASPFSHRPDPRVAGQEEDARRPLLSRLNLTDGKKLAGQTNDRPILTWTIFVPGVVEFFLLSLWSG
jgi:hypothetical protein